MDSLVSGPRQGIAISRVRWRSEDVDHIIIARWISLFIDPEQTIRREMRHPTGSFQVDETMDPRYAPPVLRIDSGGGATADHRRTFRLRHRLRIREIFDALGGDRLRSIPTTGCLGLRFESPDRTEFNVVYIQMSPVVPVFWRRIYGRAPRYPVRRHRLPSVATHR